jgi:serine/threonine protein kinase
VTHSGCEWPPCIIIERGESLDEWVLRIKPDFPTILQVLVHLTERMQTLHAAGYVHRDLKPANCLWRPEQHSWTLIDFGCTARIGATLPSVSHMPGKRALCDV